MIRHVVLFSAKTPEAAPEIARGLRMLGAIPEVRRFEVALNEKRDALSSEVDVVLYAEFDTLEALERYKRHPIYAACIAVVRPLRSLRVVADWTTEPPEKGGIGE